MSNQGRITGVGGIFFKSDDPKTMRAWYQEKLGLNTNDYGTLFEFRSSTNPEQKEYLQWSPFAKDTKYFEPSSKDFMINFRVDNLEAVLKNLKAQGVEQIGETMHESYGNFAHVMDPEGNKIELWEPIEPAFTDMANNDTHK